MNESKSSVNFACQRCLQPLRLDESLLNLGEHQVAELTLPIHKNSEIDLEEQITSLDHYVPPAKLSDSSNGASDFIIVPLRSETVTMGHHLQVKAALFDCLSNNSDVDHPLCDECSENLLDLIQHQVNTVEGEYKDYNEYLQKLENEKDDLNTDVLVKELEDYKKEEARLMTELLALQKEEKAMDEEIAIQVKEKERLDKEQEKYWREYTRHRKESVQNEENMKYYESQLSFTQIEHEKLKKINVFKAGFQISDSGKFGIINNFRLGRLPSAPVDWSEINAAWGQTVLLLSSLARKINFTFVRYKLVPYGNHSFIEVIEDQKVLPLYGSGGFRFLWDTKFDTAMVAFLDCVQQFQEHVERENNSFRFPYRTDKGKLEDTASPPNAYSIKIQFNSEEHWTMALKYMLTNLKWAVTWISSQFTEEEADSVI